MDAKKKNKKRREKSKSTEYSADETTADRKTNNNVKKKNKKSSSGAPAGGGGGTHTKRHRKSHEKIAEKSNDKNKSTEIVTKKIVHDPKIIGALPCLPLFYQQLVEPVKDRHKFNQTTKTTGWNSTEMIHKPTVLVMGNAESGKTTLINYLLREKKGYESYYDAVKDHKFCYTHLTYDEKTALYRGTQGAENQNWAFHEIIKYNRAKTDCQNECQIQLLTLKSPLLQEITFIDSPQLTESNFFEDIQPEKVGFTPILKNLIEKVDLIIYVSLERPDPSSSKIIALLSKYGFKTIYCLNKCDQFRNYDNYAQARKTFSEYITRYAIFSEPKILCTYFKGTISHPEVQRMVHIDNDILLARIKNLPTQYKNIRLHSLGIHMYLVYYCAVINSEMKKREKKSNFRILSDEERKQVDKKVLALPHGENFLKKHSDFFNTITFSGDDYKFKISKQDDIDALKFFLSKDYPFIQEVATDEAEIVLKFLLPLADPNKEPEPPVKEKKKIIKEIKIAIPQNDDDEDEDEDDPDKKKKPAKPKNQQQFVNIDKNVIENMMNQK
uniref:G domain-containing protein n=1 Tax=Parastrongyloides trichosuri TaxID=131310 RepID=A0A0N4ZXC5_PARTI